MKTYKVWLSIEEIDEENDHFENVSEPMDCGEFDTLEEAFDRQNEIFNAS